MKALPHQTSSFATQIAIVKLDVFIIQLENNNEKLRWFLRHRSFSFYKGIWGINLIIAGIESSKMTCPLIVCTALCFRQASRVLRLEGR